MTFQKLLLPLLAIFLLGTGWYFLSNSSGDLPQEETLSGKIESGEFKIFVNATGELQAKNSVKIKGPNGMRAVQIHRATINDMVKEGTVVKEGDYVATLDKTELSGKISQAQNELDKVETQLEQAKIDTAINLREIRNNLINLKFSIQEKKLQVEQSKYEPQMVIRQAEIDMEKTERDYNQLLQKLELTNTKALAQISEILATKKTIELEMNQLTSLAKEFIIKAPKPGMIIYYRSWNGKVTAGSEISSWNPTVAELPDLSDMISKTFVNEVDISKIKKGQEVQIKVDAFPDKEYSGKVIKVANIGEQLKGYDAKVFEVAVQLNAVDSILRPAMTTSNEVLAAVFDSVLHAPLEAIFNDSLSFIYKIENGKTIKQEVIIGESNDNSVIIEHGGNAGDEFLFIAPSNAEGLDFQPIAPGIKEEIKRKLEEEKARRQALAAEKEKAAAEYVPDAESGSGFIIID